MPKSSKGAPVDILFIVAHAPEDWSHPKLCVGRLPVKLGAPSLSVAWEKARVGPTLAFLRNSGLGPGRVWEEGKCFER